MKKGFPKYGPKELLIVMINTFQGPKSFSQPEMNLKSKWKFLEHCLLQDFCLQTSCVQSDLQVSIKTQSKNSTALSH